MRRLFPVLLLAFLTFGMPRVAEAQVTVAPFLTSNPQFLDGSGSPLNSGCVFTYAAGTTTPLVTYSDSAGSTPNSNPVILNSGGFPQAGGIWLTAAAYKFVVKSTGGSNCSTGSTITTTDGITWATPAQTFAGITSTGNAIIQPATAATGGANQSSPTLCLQGFYFNVTSLTDQWCLSDVLGTGPSPTSTFTVTHSGSAGTALFNPGAIGTQTIAQLNNRFYVDGVRYAATQTGHTNVFSDACNFAGGVGANSGGDVYLADAVIALSSQAGQLLNIPCPLHVQGAGGQASIFVAAGGISSAIPVVRLKITGTSTLFSHLENFQLQCNSGCPTAGDALLLDNGNAGAAGPQAVELHHISTIAGSFNGWDVNTTGNSAGQFAYNIHDNYFQGGASGGIKLSSVMADSQLIWHNLFRNTGYCFDITMASGAALGWLQGNNGQCGAGIGIIHQAAQPKIIFNQFESLTCTGANSTMLDFQGDIGQIDLAEVLHNNLNAHTSCTNNLKFGANSTNWHVAGNKFITNPTAGCGINVLNGSTNGTIGPNDFVGGGTANFLCNDSVAKRIQVYGNHIVGLPSFRGYAPSDGDSVYVARRNSITQTANLIEWDDETGTAMGAVKAGGNIGVSTTGGFGNGAQYIAIGSTQAASSWENTSGAADAKWWHMAANPADFTFSALNDANNSLNPIWKVNRIGAVPSSIINTPVVQNSFNRVAVGSSGFTTANNTSLQAITGLSWALPAEARNYSFHCAGSYSQGTANVAVALGIQASSAPTNIFGTATIWTSTTVLTTGVLATLTTTSATNIVSATPSATATNFKFEIDGTIEIPATANTITPMVSTAAGADAVTVLRGSYCTLY